MLQIEKRAVVIAGAVAVTANFVLTVVKRGNYLAGHDHPSG